MVGINVKKGLRNGCEYLLALFLLVSCNSVYSVKSTTKIFMIVMFFVGCNLLLNLAGIIHKIGKIFVVLAGYFSYLFILFLVVENNASSFLARYGGLVPALIILFSAYNKVQRDNFIRKIGNVAVVMAGINLIIWLLGPVLGLIHSNGSVMVNWGGYRYYESYFGVLFTNRHHAKWIYGSLIYRNLGIYTEGPMASLVFSIGLGIELFYRERFSKSRVFLLCIAVLTAFSTTGALLMLAFLGVKFYQNMKEKGMEKGSYNMVIKLLAFVVLAFVVFIAGNAILENKMMTDSLNYYSHMNAFSNGFALFKENVLTGSGLSDSGDYGNSTSGIFKVMSQGGIVFFLFYMIPYGIVLKKWRGGNEKLLILYALFFILLVTVIWQYTFLYLAFMSLGYSYALEQTGMKADTDRALKGREYLYGTKG